MKSRNITFEEELQVHGRIVYYNKGISMMPLLRQDRDLLVVEPIGGRRCRKGEVVLYKRGQDYILHRVTKVLPEGYVTWGDHNWKRDPIVYDDQILGVMTSLVRNGKEIFMDALSYRLYSEVWIHIVIPMRSMFLRGKRKIRQVRNRLLR